MSDDRSINYGSVSTENYFPNNDIVASLSWTAPHRSYLSGFRGSKVQRLHASRYHLGILPNGRLLDLKF